MTKAVPANQLWFLDSLVTIRVSTSDCQDRISILEHFVPYGSSPPLHFHRTEDEVFHVLEGEFRVRLQDQEHRLRAGDVRLIPKGPTPTALSQRKEVAALRSQWAGSLNASCAP